MQTSEAVRNARLDADESAIGGSPILRIRTGAAPANCASADSGTVLAEITLPADWMSNASSGLKSLLGTWQDTASATGTAEHFRLYASDGSTCHYQGTCSAVGGAGEMQLNNPSIATGQLVRVLSFSITAGDA